MTSHLDTDEAAGGWEAGQLSLPRMAAVNNFAEQLHKHGLSERAATAAAAAVVDPDDGRRRLGEPATLRVQGGTLLLIDVQVWSPGVSVYPANPRELGKVRYRVGGVAQPEFDLFRAVRSGPDFPGELLLDVPSEAVIADRVRDAEAWLRNNNPLADDIAAEGVMSPVILAPLTVNHRGRREAITLLAAVDGSSRTAATHEILDVDPAEWAYEAPPGTLAWRQRLGRMLREVAGDWDELDGDAQTRRRVLAVPVRIVVGFRPSPSRPVPFHVAVRNFIGLTHIRPPKQYGPAVENRAKADAVLDYLVETTVDGQPYLTAAEAKWFRGDLTPDQASAAGLSDALDVRAADIARALLHGGKRTALYVNRGIRALTAKQSPSRFERVDLAVELALRPLHGAYGDSDDSLAARRAAFQRALRLPGISEEEFGGPIWEGRPDSPRTLAQLRDDALGELVDSVDGMLQSAQIELAVKAAFYMISAEPIALRREGYGVDSTSTANETSIARILANMLGRRQGIWQAYAIIAAGRAGRPLRLVDDRGHLATDSTGAHIVLTDAVVRNRYAAAPVTETTTGLEGAANRWADVEASFVTFAKAVDAMRDVRDVDGRRYADAEGWAPDRIADLRRRLDVVDRRLGSWGDRAADLAADRARAEQLARDDDE